MHFFDSTGGLRGFKRSYYEGGVRSPSLVRWPGVTPAGAISATPWAFWDARPTLLDIADIAQLPLPKGAQLDGRSIVPALRGGSQPPPEYLYWTWRGKVASDAAPMDDGTVGPGMEGHTSAAPPGYGLRVGEMKGVVHACADHAKLVPSMGDVMELYDLTADPFETTNIAAVGRGPAIVESIKRTIVRQGLSCACFQCGARHSVI